MKVKIIVKLTLTIIMMVIITRIVINNWKEKEPTYFKGIPWLIYRNRNISIWILIKKLEG